MARIATSNHASRVLSIVAASGTACIAVATGLALLAPLAWWADLFAHFRPHYVAAGLALAVFAMIGRRRSLALAALALATVNAAPLAPFARTSAAMVSAASASTAESGSAFKVAFLNLWNDNLDPDRTLEFLRREDPDVVMLAEVVPHWARALAPVRARYPYRLENLACTQYDNCQMAIYSRRPWTTAGIEPAGGSAPLVWARFDNGPKPVTLMATHLMSGLHAPWSQKRRAQFEYLRSFLTSIDGPVVLAGDFNTTPWSADFSRLTRDAGLAHAGPRLVATWPAPLGLLGIPIDHVFAARGAEVTDLRRGPAVGSDHYPVVFRVGQTFR